MTESEESYTRFRNILDKEHNEKFIKLFSRLTIEDFDNSNIHAYDFPNIDSSKILKILEEIRGKKEIEYMKTHNGMPHHYLNDIKEGILICDSDMKNLIYKTGKEKL